MSKKYTRPWSGNLWFTKRPNYIMFMVREMTAVFVAIYLVALLVFLSKLGKGAEVFVAFLGELRSPGWMIIHALAFLAAAWHAITWFNLTPKAMPVFIGENKAPAPLVAIGMGYGPWIVLSAIIMWLVCP